MGNTASVKKGQRKSI